MITELKRFGCIASIALITLNCRKNAFDDLNMQNPPVVHIPFNINNLNDTYESVASLELSYQWGPYNVHDPSVMKAGDWYYAYSTDVAFGASPQAGIQVRKSKDLVEWEFVGWAFKGLPAMGSQFITSNGGTPNSGLWAPYIMKVGSEYRLYYSLASNAFRVSAIGLATATSPEGPWTEKGLAVTSTDGYPGTNAIDPTVVVTPAGEHWMVYGSAWDGLFEVKLNPATGLAATSSDKGKRIVRRGITNGKYNGNLEGAEMIYNPATQKYYLFVAYDWLSTKYNVRVFRSDKPDGPFLDWNGVDVDDQADNGPMILAPYKFTDHAGWAGTAHCAVFSDGSGNFFMAHQGRPAVNRAYMVMHVRKMFWTTDGWPLVSPERYANVSDSTVTAAEIAGDYDQIVLGYTVVPGYENEQQDPQYSVAFNSSLNADGKINGDANNTWTYNAPWLELHWNNGQFIDKLHVSRERDWEAKKNSTIVLAGYNGGGTVIWAKKK